MHLALEHLRPDFGPVLADLSTYDDRPGCWTLQKVLGFFMGLQYGPSLGLSHGQKGKIKNNDVRIKITRTKIITCV